MNTLSTTCLDEILLEIMNLNDDTENTNREHSDSHPSDVEIFCSMTREEMARLVKTEEGWNYCKAMLKSGNSIIRHKISESVYENMVDYMTSEYGSKLFRRVMKTRDNIWTTIIFSKLVDGTDEILIKLSEDQYGSKSIQKLVSLFPNSMLMEKAISILSKRICTLMNDENGKDVIYTCFKLVDDRIKEKLSEAVVNNFLKLATHEVGCKSLARCMDYMSYGDKESLLDLVVQETLFFATHRNGYCVLQQAIKLVCPSRTSEICDKLFGKYQELSRLEYGRHVVESCIKSEGIYYVIREINTRMSREEIVGLAMDKYGNYVIQTAIRWIKLCDVETFQYIVNVFCEYSDRLLSDPIGRDVFLLLLKELDWCDCDECLDMIKSDDL